MKFYSLESFNSVYDGYLKMYISCKRKLANNKKVFLMGGKMLFLGYSITIIKSQFKSAV